MKETHKLVDKMQWMQRKGQKENKVRSATERREAKGEDRSCVHMAEIFSCHVGQSALCSRVGKFSKMHLLLGCFSCPSGETVKDSIQKANKKEKSL